ncbi:hypothetical protein G7Y89_g3645 [Cudoniella acicularis]|uniref:Uncharacterized protein n=1 Tax=Cudoniella acicularis TaxID=354080 RepID=A0A8H4RRT3_9HELO|nr:hypothetical protein G7Y89_g3645 [Cudoniella acicularis]
MFNENLDQYKNFGIAFHPSAVERLLSADIRHLRASNHKNQDLFHIKNTIRYIGFCKDTDEINEKSSAPIDHAQMDAAYLRLLMKKYKKYEPKRREVPAGVGKEEDARYEKLRLKVLRDAAWVAWVGEINDDDGEDGEDVEMADGDDIEAGDAGLRRRLRKCENSYRKLTTSDVSSLSLHHTTHKTSTYVLGYLFESSESLQHLINRKARNTSEN